MFKKLILLLVALSIPYSSASIICESNGTTNYAYNLPDRNILSCPVHQAFTFSCHAHHIINIDHVIFSPFLPNPTGECTSDWTAECNDKGPAFNYLKSRCNSRDTCTIGSVELRSYTKCQLNEVISIHYKCIPTWEVMEVPIKCDLCKNVTYTSGLTPNFGFLHSTWYPNLEAHVTCNSQIQNKPNHIVVMYTVNGFIGPDKILVETYNEYGIYVSQTLTGNITTNLILTSNYNVNITIIPTTYQVFNQLQFLIYYYVVPKCEFMLCPDPPVYPIYTTIPTTTILATTLATTIPSTSVPTTMALITTTVDYDTFAPPLIADKKKGAPPTISDAWLAAICGLVYACIMIGAVLGAIYFRRRRKSSVTDTQVFLSPSMVSTSRVMTNPSHLQSRAASMSDDGTLSLKTRDYQNEMYTHEQHQSSGQQHVEQTYEEYGSHVARVQGHQGMLRGMETTGMNNSGFNEFETFSQVIGNMDNEYGGNVVGVQMMQQERLQQHVEMNSMGYPFSNRTDNSSTTRSNQVSAFGTMMTHAGSSDVQEISAQALKIDRITSQAKSSYISTHTTEGSKKTVKLFPGGYEPQSRPNEDETQEMTMFVENNYELDGHLQDRAFKIDLNNN